MRLIVAMARLLIILLLVRMIAAPLAPRPTSPQAPFSYHVVARVCAWPAPSPQLAPSLPTVLRLYVGNGRGAVDDQAFWLRLLPFDPLTRAVLSLLGSRVAPDSSVSPLVGCLRC